jgi:heme exporter protein A
VLEAAGIDCERGGKLLFRRLSFALGRGEALRITGANGRGKTSLLRILCGLLMPAAGVVRWNGEPIGELREDFSRQLVYIGHAPAVKDDLTAEENLSIACRLGGLAADEKQTREALRRFSVPEKPFLKRLSQGQRRRAALARLALSGSVPLWLLDEPLAALDTDAGRLVEELIGDQVARGGMVVFTTHQETRIGVSSTLSLDEAAG